MLSVVEASWNSSRSRNSLGFTDNESELLSLLLLLKSGNLAMFNSFVSLKKDKIFKS